MPNYKKGDKVVPFQKTVEGYGYDLYQSGAWKSAQNNGQKYLFVGEYKVDEDFYVLHSTEKLVGGDYFNEDDFYAYIEPQDLNYHLNKIKEFGYVVNEENDGYKIKLIEELKIDLDSNLFESFYGTMYSLDTFISHCENGSTSSNEGYVDSIMQNGYIIYNYELTPSEFMLHKKQLIELQEKLGKIQIMWYNI